MSTYGLLSLGADCYFAGGRHGEMNSDVRAATVELYRGRGARSELACSSYRCPSVSGVNWFHVALRKKRQCSDAA